MTDLRNKAARFEFGDLKDELILDRIVCGINDDTVRSRLLREAKMTWRAAFIFVGRLK